MFRKDFVWGCATSAFQVEGALTEGGRKKSIWDVFTQEEGHIKNDATADVSCDFYHRYKEDIALMKQVGIQALRISLSWSRILPDGVGKVNEEGIHFYNNVINELLKNDIEPFVTLYHWDLPQALEEQGGWLNPNSIEWFAEYSKVVAEAFADRVKYFFTFNEPQCFIGLGYNQGTHAPGKKIPYKDQFSMVHNVLKAHGRSVITLREYAKQPIKIGYAPTGSMAYPASDSTEDIEAARKVLFSCPDDMNQWTWNTTWFSDPVYLGTYPEDGLKKYAEYLPEITSEDMKLIAQPLDFLGENIYNGYAVFAGDDGEPHISERPQGFPITGNGWPVTPDCFFWGLRFLYERYKHPIYVTENGCCNKDVLSSDGRVHDSERVDFLNRYLIAMKKVVDAGTDIRGYFEWSFTDNFEWSEGYRDRFGIVYVDFSTQRRYLKDSAYWYADVIRTNGENLMEPKEILFIEPVLKKSVWGGNRMREEYGYPLENENTGECWAISAHSYGECAVKGGSHAGMPLSKLWEKYPELFHHYKADKLPLIVKIIDAKEDLSIQVHPDDHYARVHEGNAQGKAECWYVLDCAPNATLVLGHNAKTREELCSMIDEQRWSELIKEIPIHAGDFIQVPPGTLHAIKGGILLLETQQYSDITYRLYDYDRAPLGHSRRLHIDQCKEVINVPETKIRITKTSSTDAVERLVKCEYYTVWKINVAGTVKINQDNPFMFMSVVEGCGTINATAIHKGDHFILPYQITEIQLEGNMTLIGSAPNMD